LDEFNVLESDSANILKIRHAITHAAVRNRDQVTESGNITDPIINTFGNIFHHLLSKPIQDKRVRQLHTLVNDAVSLSTEIAVEMALFRWSLISSDTKSKEVEEFVDIRNASRNRDKVLWCTFPCFFRRLKESGAEEDICVVKGTVEFREALPE
jgi:hypothetical protein